MAAIFDIPLTLISESVHTSPVVLANLGNVGVVFPISLPSCVWAEISRCFISTSGYWRSSPTCDSRRHCTVFISVPLCSSTTKCGFGHWNIICILCRSPNLHSSNFLPAYGGHLDFRFEHSDKLYIVEIQFERPTFQCKPRQKLPTRSEDNGRLRKPPPLRH